jgi:glutamyl-tRNA reductase
LLDLLARADVVVSCTGSADPIFTTNMADRLLSLYPDKRLTIMDMAVPRDVEFSSQYAEGISVYDLEHVQQHVEKQKEKRLQEVPGAEEIVEKRLAEFVYWYHHLRNETLLNGLSDSFEAIRQMELATVLKRLDPGVRDEVDQATSRMVHRLLKIAMRSSLKPNQSV